MSIKKENSRGLAALEIAEGMLGEENKRALDRFSEALTRKSQKLGIDRDKYLSEVVRTGGDISQSPTLKNLFEQAIGELNGDEWLDFQKAFLKHLNTIDGIYNAGSDGFDDMR